MKIARGILPDGKVVSGKWLDGGALEIAAGNLEAGFQLTGEIVRPERWLPPIQPVAIWGIGLNYRQHAAEMGSKLPTYPVCFMKPPGAATGHLEPIPIPGGLCTSDRVDYECELAVVIGRTAKNVSRESAWDVIAGYTCANDVSARDWQKDFGGSQWCRGKSFDGFCPLGPFLITADELTNPQDLRIQTRLNGQSMQDGHTGDMIFDIPTLIEFLSSNTTLHAGTVILTGTPSGVGTGRTPPIYMQPGDEVEVEIEGIGVLKNTVRPGER